MEQYYIYILSNKNRTVLYIGYTAHIKRRLNQHKNKCGALFTKKYNAVDLIYVEVFNNRRTAKRRERQLKNWHREWKWNLIKQLNPELKTIEATIKGPETSSGHN